MLYIFQEILLENGLKRMGHVTYFVLLFPKNTPEDNKQAERPYRLLVVGPLSLPCFFQ